MSCNPPYCMGSTGKGCIPRLSNGEVCPSCKCCPPKCYDKLTVIFKCGTPYGKYISPPPGLVCCSTEYDGCCNTPPSCPECNTDIYGTPSGGSQDYSNNCQNMNFFDNSYLKYKSFKNNKKTIINYHDFFGFTSDDYLNDYFFSIEEVQALNEVSAETTCGGAATPCQNLTFEMTFSGCCFSCPAQSRYVCSPQTNCGISSNDPRSFVWGSQFAAIGSGSVTITSPDPPCGKIYYYINGIETKSAAIKNCHSFSVEVHGVFNQYDCCTCCFRSGNDHLTIHNWNYSGGGSRGFLQKNKDLMQKNLAEKMKKIKF